MLPDAPCIPPLFGGCSNEAASPSPISQSGAGAYTSKTSSGAVTASGSVTTSALPVAASPVGTVAVLDHQAATDSVGAKPCPVEYKTADYKTGDYKTDGYKTTGYKPVPGYKPCPVTYVPRAGAATEFFLGKGKTDFVILPGGSSSLASIFPPVLWLALFSMVCIGLLLKAGFAQKMGKNRLL